MKALRLVVLAVIAAIAATSSGFTSKENKAKNTLYYFANATHANPPGTNDFLYKGMTDPGSTHCTAGVPICYGSSTSAPDANGHPTGTVTTLRSGNWHD